MYLRLLEVNRVTESVDHEHGQINHSRQRLVCEEVEREQGVPDPVSLDEKLVARRVLHSANKAVEHSELHIIIISKFEGRVFGLHQRANIRERTSHGYTLCF
jgi:hypothetical protein